MHDLLPFWGPPRSQQRHPCPALWPTTSGEFEGLLCPGFAALAPRELEGRRGRDVRSGSAFPAAHGRLRAAVSPATGHPPV